MFTSGLDGGGTASQATQMVVGSIRRVPCVQDKGLTSLVDVVWSPSSVPGHVDLLVRELIRCHIASIGVSK